MSFVWTSQLAIPYANDKKEICLKTKAYDFLRMLRPMLPCIDPVNSCSGVNVEGNDDEHPDGRRHQALDSQA